MPSNIVGIDIVVNWNEVLRQTNLRRFRAHKGCLIIFHHEPYLLSSAFAEMSPYVGRCSNQLYQLSFLIALQRLFACFPE